jgi:hypothetical protein
MFGRVRALLRAVRIACAIVVAACGSSPHPVAKPDVPEVAPAAPAGAMLASFDDNHVVLVEVADRVIPRATVDMPERIRSVRWLDRDRLVALGDSGQLVLVDLGTSAPRITGIEMPAAQAWDLPIPTGAERAKFPGYTFLIGTDSVSLVSCIGYMMGDTNPCVAWAGADISLAGTVDPVTALGEDKPDDVPPSEVIAPALGIAVRATFTGPTVSVECTDRGVHHHRELAMEDCPANDTQITWVATDPPLIGLVLRRGCVMSAGLGLAVPDFTETRVLAACALTDVEAARDPIVWHGAWAHFVSDEVGWHVHAGVRLIGTIQSSDAPQLRPR